MGLTNSLATVALLIAGVAHGAPSEPKAFDGELFGYNSGYAANIVERCAATRSERERVKKTGSELIAALSFVMDDLAAIKRGFVRGTAWAIKKFPPPKKPPADECAEAREYEKKIMAWPDEFASLVQPDMKNAAIEMESET